MKIRLIPMLLLFSLVTVTAARANEVTDMHGRKLQLPSRVQRVIGASPPVTYLLYSIDPDLVAGLNLPPDENLRRFLRPETANKPVTGAFGGGQGRNFNAEGLLSVAPELVVAWPPRSGIPRIEQTLTGMKIPLAYLRLDALDDYPAAYEFLGEALGRKERCRELAGYFRSELKKMRTFSAGIPAGPRVSVYFAQERDGLQTVSADSVHSEAIALAGGRNVHQGDSGNLRGKERVSIEQVLSYDPEVIVVQDPEFFDSVYHDQRWARVKAVRDHRVYLIPAAPFSWLDQPPSFLRLLGAKWLAHRLYPQRFRTDIAVEAGRFFKLFWGRKLGTQELHGMLSKVAS